MYHGDLLSVFARRSPRSYLTRFWHLFFPPIGVRRSVRYLLHRLRRMPGTPYAIAAGFACGAAVSFTPFIGLHFILAGLIAWAIGANILASAFGTAVGNPWTFPFIWAWIFQCGDWILGRNAELGAEAGGMSWSLLMERPWDLLLPMIVGGVPNALLVWGLFFLPLWRLISAYQHQRQHRLASIRAERQNGDKAGDGQTSCQRHRQRIDTE